MINRDRATAGAFLTLGGMLTQVLAQGFTRRHPYGPLTKGGERANNVGAAMILLGLFVFMTACAGPSKARYAELLHECRDANREHVRLLKEYGTVVDRNNDLLRKLCEANRRPIKQALCDDLCNLPAMSHPEQTMGGAEFGVGGQ